MIQNTVLLLISFLFGVIAIAVCVLARFFFMQTPPNWLTFDYTTAGWVLRTIAMMLGGGALVLATFTKKGSRPDSFRRFVYRADVAIALTAITYEVAVPIILMFVIIVFIGNLISSPSDDTAGCLGGLFNVFDFDGDE